MITPTARRVIPAPTSRVADDSGVVDPGWYGFFRIMWLRTGGGLGNGVALGNSPDLLLLQKSLNEVTALVAAGNTLADTITAGTSVGGHRVLMFDAAGHAVYANTADPNYNFAGVSLGAAAVGTGVAVVSIGTIAEASWSWVPGAPLYTGLDGALSTQPPARGWLQQIAVALTATTIRVQAFSPINRL